MYIFSKNNGTKVYLSLFFILQQIFSLVVCYGINIVFFF